MIKKILEIYYKMGEHKVYVEVFGGSGALLFAKRPSKIEVYNDLHSGLVNLYRVLRNSDQFAEFERLCNLSLYSREEYKRALKTWQGQSDPVQRAYKFYIVAKQSFGGRFGAGWSFSKKSITRGIVMTCSSWLVGIEQLSQIHSRLLTVQIENKDFRDLIGTYDDKETLFYLDPPYVQDTRKQGGYDHEMSDFDHAELISILLSIKGQAMLSGYDHAIYNPLVEAGWVKVQFDVVALSDKNIETKKRTETIWHTDTAIQQRLF